MSETNSTAERLIIFDTTLRDGEQSPGASMTMDEKVRIARALEKMHVDVIEAGFPIASVGDFEAVKAVAEAVKDSTICGLARALDKDIERVGEALKPAGLETGEFRTHSYLHCHLADSYEKQVAHESRAGAGTGRAGGEKSPPVYR